MKEISNEYLKIYRSVVIRLWLVTAICAGAFAAFGIFKSDYRVFAVIVCGVFAGFSLGSTISIFACPKEFERRLRKAPNDVREEILNGKFSALGARRFYENLLLYYTRTKIHIVKYDEIKRVEIKSILKAELTLESGKKLSLPTAFEENSAVICAAFKSKNPKTEFVINGKTIEKTDEKGRKK